jgi:hypothetical protein
MNIELYQSEKYLVKITNLINFWKINKKLLVNHYVKHP